MYSWSTLARVNIRAEPSSPQRPSQPRAQRPAVVADLRASVRRRSRGEIASFIAPTKVAAIDTPARRHGSPSADPVPPRARGPETCRGFPKRCGGKPAAIFASVLPVRRYWPAGPQPRQPVLQPPRGRHRSRPAPSPRMAAAVPSTHPASAGLKPARTVRTPCSTVPVHILGDGCFISGFCLLCLYLS